MEELGVVKYDITEAAIEEMRGYLALKVTGLDDEAGFKMVHEKRMIVKGHRVAIEKRRKELKAGALEFGREVDSKAKQFFDIIEPIETHLQTEEDKVTKEKERIRAEKVRVEQERVEGIRAKMQGIKEKGEANFFHGKSSTILMGAIETLSNMEITEDVFMEFRQEAEKVMYDTLKALRFAHDEILLFEQEEANRKAEAERLAKQRVEQEAKEKAIEEERRKIQAEKAALEAEKKAAQERKDREEFERQAKETARITAERNAIEKVAREAREAKEKAEAEAAEKAQKAAMAPDKAKIITWARELNQRLLDMHPALSSDEAKRIIFDAEKAIDKAVALAVKRAKEL